MATQTMLRTECARNAPAVYNLLHERWLPVRRRDGQRALINPAQVTDDLQSNPVVSIDWPRPDFRAATLELLIGLLATACPPADEDEWLEGWRTPPSPDALAAAFAPLAAAFNLDDPAGPCFAQDHDAALPGEPDVPATLLIEAPGGQTERDNKTLFVKSGRADQLSRATAAIALYTLQNYAPSGGRGNLTSLRGGGPLTTLVLPGAEPTLWHVLWANVPQGKQPAARDLPRVFPWLAETRTADRYPATAPADAHPLQAFWGMPRRIRLSFADNAAGLPCALTGVVDAIHATGWRQRPNGVKYTSWDHPLSPYYKNSAAGDGWLPLHPQPGGIGYQHWAGLVVGDATGSRRPAHVITAWQSRQLDLPAEARDARIFASGFDTDNMKARGFVESEMPLPGSGDPTAQQGVAFLAQHLISAAEETARAVRYAVRDARYPRGTATDSAPLAAIYEAFWQATQSGFFRLLHEASPEAGAPVERALEQLADNPAFGREAAVQVAHAITTHRVTVEDDFYTAVDDLKSPTEDAGAGFMGELGFGSGVFYLYACVDLALLTRNLGGDDALAATACAALASAAATVSPSGKQASFAALARAHYVLAERGTAQPRTLAGAFLRPVSGDDLATSSISALRSWRDSLDRAYGPVASAQFEIDVAAGHGTLAELRSFCGRDE